jgi:hypothetical protein
MPEPIDPAIERAAEAVADEAIPDWVPDVAGSPELRRAVTGLRIIARLAAAHREARRQLLPEREATTEHSPAGESPELREPVFSWGFLRALDRLGEGSFGEVWRAWDPSLEREVALKLRRLTPAPAGGPPLARTSDPATRHWLEEARRLASVRHPNVLTVYGAAEHEGRAGLWTELVRGESVEDRLAREGPLALREAARIGRDLCHALVAVHDAGLVHGDVKTANVMLEPSPRDATGATRVVLMDFGAAHAAARGGRTRSPLDSSAGTPLVMAPEVLGGEPASPAADLYSVGVMLFRMLTGRYPVEAESLEALRERHERGERLAATAVRPGLPPPFVRVLNRALAGAPGERPASAAELARALDPFAEPGRGRRMALVATGCAIAVLLAITFAIVAFRHPSDTRLVPPERLPGPQVAAMRLADTAVGAGKGELFGNDEAGVGDVNGDGFADVLVGGAHYSGALYLQGRVALYLGNRAGRLGAPAWTAYGHSAGDYFGAYLGAAGDVNGDGYADVLITDQCARPSDHQEVRSVSLYLGSSKGLEPEPVSRIMGWQPHAGFGMGISGIGDVNGDGYGDVVIGANNYTHSLPYEGAAFVYYGGPHGLRPRPDWVLYGGARDAWLGYLVTRAGDVNGDGYPDLLVGAPGWKGGHTSVVGRVMLFAGGSHGLATTPLWTAEGDQPGGAFGYAVGGVGDVNHDGCADFVVMQPGWSGRGAREGRALLYLGGKHGPAAKPAWTAQGFSSGAGISTGGAGIGDVNGDGIPDILVGSGLYSASLDRRQLGVVGVFLSPRDPRQRHAAWYHAGDDPGTPIAAWLAPAGDFNGDGLADMVVGQPGWYRGDQRGRVLMFLGQRTPLPR